MNWARASSSASPRQGMIPPVGAEIGAAAAAMTDGQPLDALLLECTDLSVFARTVQEAVSVPVYDINSLIAYAAFCVRRNQWV